MAEVFSEASWKVLVLTFNEGGKPYSNAECGPMSPLLQQIRSSMAHVLVVCTQESNPSAANRFHLLFSGTVCQMTPFVQIYSTTIGLFKTLRTSVFLRADLLGLVVPPETDRVTIPAGSPLAKAPALWSSDRGCIGAKPGCSTFGTNVDFDLRAESVRGSSKGLTGKGRVALTMTLKHTVLTNFPELKLVIVHTHLDFSGGSDDQGYEKRQKALVEMIEDFALVDRFTAGYGIVICGDLNFRNRPLVWNGQRGCGQKTSQQPYSKCAKPPCRLPTDFAEGDALYQDCGEDVIRLYRQDDLSNLKSINELAQLLLALRTPKTRLTTGLKQFAPNKQPQAAAFLTSLLESLYLTVPTCKLIEDEKRAEIVDQASWAASRPTYLMVDPKDRKPRIPSSCDQILFAANAASALTREWVRPFSVGPMRRQSDHIALLGLIQLTGPPTPPLQGQPEPASAGAHFAPRYPRLSCVQVPPAGGSAFAFPPPRYPGLSCFRVPPAAGGSRVRWRFGGRCLMPDAPRRQRTPYRLPQWPPPNEMGCVPQRLPARRSEYKSGRFK